LPKTAGCQERGGSNPRRRNGQNGRQTSARGTNRHGQKLINGAGEAAFGFHIMPVIRQPAGVEITSRWVLAALFSAGGAGCEKCP
jgi:hypothetical protein